MTVDERTRSHLDRRIAEAQRDGRAPSLVAGVVSAGQTVWTGGAGETPTPDVDTGYRIGSITKSMTAALVMSQRDAGALDLSDPLERHLPGTPVGGLSMRALLGHASGLRREPDGDWWERAAGTDEATLLAGLTPDSLTGPPHRAFHYSNLAYGLLGLVLEHVTGTRWADLVAERLLAPLGMGRTSYHPAEPFARGYLVHPWHRTLREEPRHDAGVMAPAGQLWSTVSDLLRWAAFLAEPDPAILAADTVGEMCAPVVIADPDRWTAGNGLGLQLWRRGERVFAGHTGSMPGYQAILAVHRPSRTGVVAFTNTYRMRGAGLHELSLDLLTEVLDTAVPTAAGPAAEGPWRPATAAPPAGVEPLTGRWWWMGQEYEAAWDNDELVITPLSPASEPWRCTPDGADRWRCRTGMNAGEFIRVLRSPDGTVRGLDAATFVLVRDPWPDI